MVFSLHLVYLSTAACISEKNIVGSMLAQGFLRVKGQGPNHKMLLFVSWHNKYAIIEWPLLKSTHGAYISVEISLGSCWRSDILRVKGQGLITNCNFL